MADLIDRQTIIDTIHSAIYPYFCGAEDGDALGKDEKLVLSVNKTICTAIKALPSADIDLSGFSDKLWKTAYERGKDEAVRHGHWLRTGRTNVYGGFEVECSVCNDNVMITNIEYEHYCRNCGARMDEGSEDGFN